MSDSRVQTWLAVMVAGIGLVVAAVLGLFAYMSFTATPLHPNAQEVPSVTQLTPLPKWAGAVAQGREAVRADLTRQNLPGISVAVGVGGSIVWAEAFGWADIDNRVKVAPDTRFRIGTASTPLTSAAVGLLLERNELQLDEKIQAHVPEFPEKQWPVTLRQVMGHVAGLRSDGGDEGPLFSERCDRPVDALQYFKDSELRFEPGTQYRYSNFGFILVSAAVEAAAGEPFLSFMRKQIIEPLGMDRTVADFATAGASPERATSYFPKFGGDPRYGPDVMRPLDYSCYAGSSVFLSTPSDLVRFGMAINGGTLVRPATVQLLQTSQRLPSGKETGYGLGWDLESVTLGGTQTTVAGHDGELLGGTVSSLMIFRERGIVVAVITNTSYADTAAIALKIAEAFAAQETNPGRATR